MGDLFYIYIYIRYIFIEGMAKEVIEMTCAVMVEYVPGVQGVHEAVSIGPRYLTFLPDHLKAKGMCDEAVRRESWTLKDVPDHLKTQEMCKRVVRKTHEC